MNLTPTLSLIIIAMWLGIYGCTRPTHEPPEQETPDVLRATPTATPAVVLDEPGATPRTVGELEFLDEAGWTAVGEHLTVVPGMYRTSGPLRITLSGGGYANLSGDTQFWVGPAKKTLRLLEGCLALRASKERLSLMDEFGTEVLVENGELVARRFPDRMEYLCREGNVRPKSLAEQHSDEVIRKNLKPGDAFFTNGVKAAFVRGGMDAQLGAFMMLSNADVANEMAFTAVETLPSAQLRNIRKRGKNMMLNPGGMLSSKDPLRFSIRDPDRSVVDWDREIEWRMDPPQPKVTGYLVRLYRLMGQSEPVLLWSGFSDKDFIRVPDYVETPLGHYKVTANPMIGKALVDLEARGTFRLTDKREAAPEPSEPTGETVATVEKVSPIHDLNPKSGPSLRYRWEAGKGFGIRQGHTLYLTGQVLQAGLGGAGNLIFSGTAEARFTRPGGVDDGAVVFLRYGDMWTRLNGMQKRFTVVTSLAMIQVSDQPVEIAVTSDVRTGKLVVLKGQARAIASGKVYSVKEGEVLDLKSFQTSVFEDREQGLAEADFSELDLIKDWISQL